MLVYRPSFDFVNYTPQWSEVDVAEMILRAMRVIKTRERPYLYAWSGASPAGMLILSVPVNKRAKH